jgi:hypothetical protein
VDLNGRATVGTNGKVRVTVTKITEVAPDEPQAPADLKTRDYVLRGATQDWKVGVSIPGLTSELIKVGDALDFQLEASPGFVPLVSITNQAFGLFAPEGELLVFGAATFGFTPMPNLTFLGLNVSDGGTVCGTGGGAGYGCSYAAMSTHFSAPGGELDLQPGQSGQIQGLLIGVQEFHHVVAPVVANAGGCEDTGRSLIVGVKTAVNDR